MAAHNKIKLTWEKMLYSIARNGELPPFLYYSQVYLRSLPNQLMKQQYSFLFLGMYVDVVRKWALWDFLHFGVLSHTEKGTKLAVLGLSTALSEIFIHLY